jgi:tyrosyl-tRNA synthetase
MTYHPKSEFLHEITTRGFLADCTDLQELDARLTSGVVTGYIGYDLTASSLHIGNLVQIMLLRWLQKTGHRPITLMGGGTTKVGDPSGKDEMRKIISAMARQIRRWSTTRTGWTSWAMWIFCAILASISRSTACWHLSR